jgi:spore coat polysaccharide biosynthesis protein SpsF (cytidylyltransferase family)
VCEVFRWDGPENDVLGRFYHCAHRYRWWPGSVIVRITPDDPFKTVDGLRRVARGERMPVEIGGEAFTLDMLTDAHEERGALSAWREHMTFALFAEAWPSPAPGPHPWTIDTAEDLGAARKWLRKDLVRDTEPFDADTLVTWV